MKSNKILIASVVLQWLLLIASVIAGLLEQSRLTGIFAECRNAINAHHFTPYQIAILLFGGVLVIVNLIASVGLCRLKRWARTLYIWSYIAGTITVLVFFEPDIITPVSNIISEWGTIFVGITISLMYWSPLAKEYN